jgi:hypothetical protein
MSEVLLQTIIEKLEAMELLLKQYKSNKDEEVLKTMLQEIKKISTSSINIDKIDELKLSIERCSKALEHTSTNQIIYKHYLHKGIGIAATLFFVSTFFLCEWMNTTNEKKQFEANDIKYRALKISGDKTLLNILYQTDSFYNVHADWMRKYVTREEDRLMEQTRMSQLAGEKKTNVKDVRNRAEKK